MAVDPDTGHTHSDASLSPSESRDRLDARLTGPPVFERPPRWTFTKAWQRAQTEEIVVAPKPDPAEFGVILGDGLPHVVTFVIYDDELRAECDCGAYEYHYDGTWCPHIAALWWRWAVWSLLVVVDVNSGARYDTPPHGLRIRHEARELPARADGGGRR